MTTSLQGNAMCSEQLWPEKRQMAILLFETTKERKSLPDLKAKQGKTESLIDHEPHPEAGPSTTTK